MHQQKSHPFPREKQAFEVGPGAPRELLGTIHVLQLTIPPMFPEMSSQPELRETSLLAASQPGTTAILGLSDGSQVTVPSATKFGDKSR
jgi:hypothetical protein